MARRTVRTLAVTAALALALTACAAPDEEADQAPSSDDSASTGVTTLDKDDEIASMLPADIADAGVVHVASGISFPPMEYYDTDNSTPLGFDVDLGAALGQVLGVEFAFENTNFDGILGGLEAGRYDLSLTSMIDKKERQTGVDFVDYLQSGVAFMTTKDNPAGITSQEDLCGTSVAVEKSATGDIVADEVSAECVKNGDEAINKIPLPQQADTLQALTSGRADAVLALDVTLAYNVSQQPDAFKIPGEPFGLLPVGIPVPKEDTELRDAVQAALLKVQDEGVYDELLAKWNLEAQALEGAPINSGE